MFFINITKKQKISKKFFHSLLQAEPIKYGQDVNIRPEGIRVHEKEDNPYDEKGSCGSSYRRNDRRFHDPCFQRSGRGAGNTQVGTLGYLQYRIL